MCGRLAPYSKVACVPNNNKLIGLNAAFAAGWMVAAVIVGFVMVKIVQPLNGA